MVTHAELSPGYQVAQTAHALAEFALRRPEEFSLWQNGYIVCLQASSASDLKRLHLDATELSLDTVAFHEADLGNEMTAIAFTPSPSARPFLSQLPLAGKTKSTNKKEGATS